MLQPRRVRNANNEAVSVMAPRNSDALERRDLARGFSSNLVGTTKASRLRQKPFNIRNYSAGCDDRVLGSYRSAREIMENKGGNRLEKCLPLACSPPRFMSAQLAGMLVFISKYVPNT